jgi:hypothetical protein
MTFKTIVGFAFAATCLTAIATGPVQAQMAGTYGTTAGDNGPQSYSPQAGQGDMPQSPAARRNVIQSEHYDRSLETSRKFRQARERKECGPITDPELRQSCLASFKQDEPYMGSSTPHRRQHSGAGR